MKVIFMGTPDFAVPVLQKLLDDKNYEIRCVVTQPDRPKGRKHTPTPSPVKILAEKYRIPVLQPEKVRDPEAVREILSYSPDLLITAAYGQILPQSLLEGPPLGSINVHASILPEYRGAAPIQQAVIDGKKESGVTIMYMVKKLDAGDILTQVRVPIDDNDTFGILHDKLSAAGSDLLMKTLPALASGRLTPSVQDETKATFAPSIRHEDEAIDWNKPAEAVRNLIRGLNPYPGAFTLLGGKTFKVYSAHLADHETAAAPGTVIGKAEDGFFVAAGLGSVLKVTECQPAGKKRMSAADFLHGKGLEIGTLLGEEA
ncbi:methionyl-tRNA formyltransferase [Sporolactobacillus putidus]|uniref:Methionyl-tRNA formyltransferase n=1 Tax=Sporolactobacillus putidus TaxID=492735 RepID=A0A917VZM7_9BACL|nr:methionyl-tRNA formyltransferase [Sporolactobacillus putidus]GGL44363.1 methionyl-tRNA formyltransferase [Sporolactobacillus putidus]